MQPENIDGKRWVAIDVQSDDAKKIVEGWLIDEQKDSIQVLDSGGAIQKFRRLRKASVNGEKRAAATGDSLPIAVAIRPADFNAKCKQIVKEDEVVKKWYGEHYSPSGWTMVEFARFAYWAGQIGEKRLSLELYTRTDSRAAAVEKKDAAAIVASALVSEIRNQAFLDVRDDSRAESLRKWKLIASIPFHKYGDEARQMIDGYTALIAEDAAWKEPDVKSLAKLPDETRAAYWIHRLRDTRGFQCSVPGWCDVLSDDFGTSPSAAGKLVEIGMAAIPQIIAHLYDSRPTRAIATVNRFSGELYLLRYGDCCHQAFEKITGHVLCDCEYPLLSHKETQCKAEAERWWADYRRKGEKQMLVEDIEAGTHNAAEQAEKLVKHYPTAAFDAIVTGIRNGSNAWIRKRLIEIIAGMRDDRVLPYLRSELKDARRDARIAAATKLCVRGHDDGIGPAVEEWRRIRWEDEVWDQRESGIDDLIFFLARCGQPEAIEALSKRFSDGTYSARRCIIGSLQTPPIDLRHAPFSERHRSAADALLVGALRDSEVVHYEASGGTSPNIWNPTFGDLAANELAERWGKKELFNIAAPLWVREPPAMRTANVWLKKGGQPTSLLPTPRKIVPLTDEQVQAKLAATRQADNAAKRRAALGDLEALGLPGEASVCERRSNP